MLSWVMLRIYEYLYPFPHIFHHCHFIDVTLRYKNQITIFIIKQTNRYSVPVFRINIGFALYDAMKEGSPKLSIFSQRMVTLKRPAQLAGMLLPSLQLLSDDRFVEDSLCSSGGAAYLQ
jgi:hypothetical protein